MFQVSEREAENDGAVFREILKVLRLILYFVLITAILGGTVAARASFLLLTSGVVQVCGQPETAAHDRII